MRRQIVIGIMALIGLAIVMMSLLLLLAVSSRRPDEANDTISLPNALNETQKDMNGRIAGALIAKADSKERGEEAESDVDDNYFKQTLDMVYFYVIFKISIVTVMILGKKYM